MDELSYKLYRAAGLTVLGLFGVIAALILILGIFRLIGLG